MYEAWSYQISIRRLFFRQKYQVSIRNVPRTLPLQLPKPALAKDFPSPPILNQGQCGVSKNDQSQQIVGGGDAPANAWPWQVSLRISSARCGGVIISSEWIVTAAHCLRGNEALVFYGNNNYRKANTTRTKAVFEHEDDAVDLALFKLSSPLTFTDSVQPICLPEGNIWDASPCFVTGWGSTQHFIYKSVAPDLLQQLRVRLLNQTLCIAYNSFLGIIDLGGNNLCMTSAGHSSASKGDSGSALSCFKNGRYYLVGVLTHVIPLDGDFISYAVSVPENIQWITDTINENS
ncbi:chymotrypsin-like elastase family member 2A [Physella acuta]|uniref:chymotrypsin-like elastase family member 2A n=1 Tax=Physella acuta TaxID=109671 RepID=UPI0027DE0320|nr:chymotrypsin-like elastase family member 2A [Physella acuta]XP_059153232.1 chymotrypsin-like elastase family member 2A [Physella acuta]